MFVTFNSDAYENITYFDDVAKQLLSLMGHSGTVPGAIKADQVADALGSLQQALAGQKENATPSDDEKEPAIDLKKRAVPLLNLLQAAATKKSDVLWTYSNSPG